MIETLALTLQKLTFMGVGLRRRRTKSVFMEEENKK